MHRDVEKQLSLTFFSYHKCVGTIREIEDMAEDLEQTKGNTVSNRQVMENPTPGTKRPKD